MHGDIAWGGNWFFLVADHRLELQPRNRNALMAATIAVTQCAGGRGYTRGGWRRD